MRTMLIIKIIITFLIIVLIGSCIGICVGIGININTTLIAKTNLYNNINNTLIQPHVIDSFINSLIVDKVEVEQSNKDEGMLLEAIESYNCEVEFLTREVEELKRQLYLEED